MAKAAIQAWFVSMLRRPRWRVMLRNTVRALRLPDPIRQRLPVDGTFGFELLGHRFSYRSELHDGVGRALFWSDPERYEAETLDVFVNLLREASDTPTVFDVGANTGFYTLAALAGESTARVHAFEPVPHIADALSHNVKANGLSARVRICRCAVTDSSGHVSLHVPDTSWGNATMSVGGFRGLDGRVERVPAVALDDYVAEHSIERVDVLKIDTEGHEDGVLRGASCLLREHRPAILCECLPELDVGALNRLIVDFDYQPYHVRATGAVRVARVEPDVTGRLKNFLLLPTERPPNSRLLHKGQR